MNRTQLSLYTLLFLMVQTPTGAVANDELLNETDFFIDIPEITSATRMPQKLSEAPASITVIDRQMIEASGLQTIPDLMRLVPGFQSYLVTANSFGTTYHGASDDFPNRLEVMVDGRSVYLPLLSTVVWESLGVHLDDIERIEVVRGSNVPTQGSNAFLGSINIITREPTASSGVDIGALVGSQDTRNLHMSYADSNGVLSYRISASHEQNDGNNHYSEFYTGDWFAADGSDGRWQDDLSRDYLNISTTWTPDLVNSFWFQFGVDRGEKTTGALDKTDGHFDTREHESLFFSTKYNRLYSDSGSIQVSMYHNYLRLDTPLATISEVGKAFDIPYSSDFPIFSSPDTFDLSLISATDQPAFLQALIDANNFHLIEEYGKTSTTDLEMQLTDKHENLQFVTGLGYRHMSASSDVLLQGGEVSEDRSRAYGTINVDLFSQWQWVSGAMYELSSEGGKAFSYRHAAIFKPSKGTSVRLGYSSSERLPSLLERYSESTIYIPAFENAIPAIPSTFVYDYSVGTSPDLDEERISSWELGLYHAFPRQLGYFDLRLFDEKISNAIFSYWDPVDEHPVFDENQRVRHSRNIGGWRNRGAEFQLKYQPIPSLQALLSYAYINTVEEHWYRGVNKGYFKTTPSMTPLHTASLLMSWSPAPSLDLSFTHYFMDDVQWLEGGYRDAYNRTDLRAAKQWQLDSDSELETALIIQNAFGPAYQEFYKYNEFDRRTYLQMKLKFN